MNYYQKWQTLSPVHQKVLTIYFEYRLSKLTNRAAGALRMFIKSDSHPELFFKAIQTADFDYTSLPNIGKPTSKELEVFYQDISIYVITIAELTAGSPELLAEENRQILRSFFDAQDEILNSLAKLASEIGYFPIFMTIAKFLEQPPLYKKYRLIFFNECLGYQQGKTIIRPQILSKKLSIGEARCRQLSNKFVADFSTDFAFINSLKLGSELIESIDLNVGLLEVGDELRAKINTNEQTIFSSRFITKVFALLLNKTHELLGHEYNNANSWKKIYLIKMEVSQTFNFVGFIDMLKAKMTERNELSYIFSIKEHLAEFKLTNTTNDYEIIDLLNKLIVEEIGLVGNQNAEISIPQNTPILLWQYIEEALIELGEARTGHSLSDILILLRRRYPEESFRQTSIMATVSQNSKFIYFDRGSDYGLKIWEETGYIKGGTIRSIIAELLESKPEPQHIHQITLHVNKFRTTDEKSIYSNIQQETNQTFLLLNDQFIGLPTKDYSRWEKPIKIAGSHFTRRSLMKFNGVKLDLVKQDFIARGYLDIQITSILSKKIEDKEIIIDEYGQLWLNEIQIFAEHSNAPVEEEMILKVLTNTSEDDREQEVFMNEFARLSRDEIISRLDRINQDTDEKGLIISSGYKRSNAAVVLIKMLRDFKCQICGYTIIKKDGSFYIEAAHITPKYQMGKETRDNILLLCPNHHKEFDLGNLSTLIRTSTAIEFMLNDQPHIILLDQR
jgi:hypothetical protein